MALIGWTSPQTSTGKSALVPPPPWHYSGDVIAIEYLADPVQVAELSPPGFVPRGDGACTFIFSDWATAADDTPALQRDPAKSQYTEAYVIVQGSYKGQKRSYVPFVWVNSDYSLVRGLIQGYPKKLGDIYMTRPVEVGRGGSRRAAGGRFAAHASSLGRRLATASVVLREQVTDAFPAGSDPYLLMRVWPSWPADRPALREYVSLQVTAVEFGPRWRGTAELEIEKTDFDELDRLRPVTMGPGWVYPFAVTILDGTTEPVPEAG
jgi:acetoacetate decarboxylase